MTYIELINDFWKKNQVSPFSSCEIAFYFYLLKECDSLGWRNPFRLPTRKICFELDFRKDTITSVRNSLKQRGVINFKKGDRRACDPEYSLLDISGGLVEIAYQNTYQNVDQSMYQNVDQNPHQTKRKEPKENNIYSDIFSNENNLLGNNTREDENPKPKRKRQSDKDPEVVRLNSGAREVFCEVYKLRFDETYVWSAADAGQMTRLLSSIRVSRSEREKPLPIDTDSMLQALKEFLMAINDNWVLGNFSVKVISSKYNEIISRIKGQRSNGYGTERQDARKPTAAPELSAEDYRAGF